MTRKLFLPLGVLMASACVGAADTERKVDFKKEIQPIFAEHCYQCHGANRAENGLRWDRKAAAFKGGEKGSPIVPGKASESLVIRAVNGGGEDVPKMPKKGEPLTAEQIELLKTWINQGADWPDSTGAEKDP